MIYYQQYIVSLLALHFFCDAVYKRTNCLWGAVILHIIYNAVGAMIIIQ
ncbi:CPBP family glutamic-type intramembrane protease [Blautia wexlerae]